MKRTFLEAGWKYLIMANYEVAPETLLPFLPPETEPDAWQGKYFVSLVGFLFHDTRVLGIKIPFHINFEEINLRFYVKHFDNGKWKRGVVFIKEIVPRAAISFVANTFFNEQYITCKTKNEILFTGDELSVKYQWKYKKEWNSLSVQADTAETIILSGSTEEFITEHYWGYSKAAAGKTTEYEVTHPRWKLHKVKSYNIACDFKKLYGNPFAHLSRTMPDSVFLAAGSEIAVKNKRLL